MNPLDWDLGNLPPGLPWGGVDEAGRGAWAGPVVAACAVLDHDAAQRWGHVLRAARDSKKLSPDRREALAAELKVVLPAWAVAEVDNLGIDRDNILESSMMAMRQAVTAVTRKPRILLVDGNRAPGTGLPERLVVDGDALSCAIACASILAKTHRDALMRALAEREPGYGFERHKGYGTLDHRTALAELGVSSSHRISYAPVAALQRTEPALPAQLMADLEACGSVLELQAWVEAGLRPNYGRMALEWVETLRDRYGERLAYLAGQELEVTRIQVAIAILERQGRVFLQRRDPAARVLPGLWEFPGGKLEPGEAAEAALRRELEEELGLAPELLVAWPHTLQHEASPVQLFPFRCFTPARPVTDLAWAWFTPAEAAALPVPGPNRELLQSLAAWL